MSSPEAGQRVDPAIKPHFLFGHGGQDLNRGAALPCEGTERVVPGIQRLELAADRLLELLCGRRRQPLQLNDVRVVGRGSPGPRGHGVEPVLIDEQLTIDRTDRGVLGHRRGGAQRADRSGAGGFVARFELLLERGKRPPVGVQLRHPALELQLSPLLRLEPIGTAGELLPAQEAGELGLGARQHAVGLRDLLGEKLAAAARTLAGPFDVDRLEGLHGRVDDALGRSGIARRVTDVHDIRSLPAADHEACEQAVDDGFPRRDVQGRGLDLGA